MLAITGGTGNILENYGVTDIGDVSVLAIESWTWIGHYQHSSCNFMECQVKTCIKKTLNIDISKSNSRFLQLVQLYYLRLSSSLLSSFLLVSPVRNDDKASDWEHPWAAPHRMPRHWEPALSDGWRTTSQWQGLDLARSCNDWKGEFPPENWRISPLKRDYFQYPYHVYLWCIYLHLVVFLW